MRIHAPIAASIALLLAACGGGPDGGQPSSGGTELPPGRVQSLSVKSGHTGFDYPITVYLPAQYDTSEQGRFPVIFAVDGDAQFGYPNGGTRFDALADVLQRRGTAAILVGVGGTARRTTDFLPGGSIPYHAFLVEELVPAIDGRYRTDPTNRILSGLSYGGTIVFLAFTYEGSATATFRQFWSTETAPPNGDARPLFDAEAALFAATQGRPVPLNLFFAGANGLNGPLVDSLYLQVQWRNYARLQVQEVRYWTSHVGADVPAFTEALSRFLP